MVDRRAFIVGLCSVLGAASVARAVPFSDDMRQMVEDLQPKPWRFELITHYADAQQYGFRSIEGRMQFRPVTRVTERGLLLTCPDAQLPVCAYVQNYASARLALIGSIFGEDERTLWLSKELGPVTLQPGEVLSVDMTGVEVIFHG